MTTSAPQQQQPVNLEPAWDVAKLFPAQGTWSEVEYFELNGNRLVEFTNGFVEVLAMPTTAHQRIVRFLFGLLNTFVVTHKLGEALFAPLRVRLWDLKYREPDIVFMLARHASRIRQDFWDGADLVMEIVSEDDRRRDVETKRFEYARAGIPEYWIVDPQQKRITVLVLDGDRYAVQAEFGPGTRAMSILLPGFSVSVDETLAAAGEL